MIRLALILVLATLCACATGDGNFIYRYRLAQHDPGKAPVVVMLHGYGSDENDLFALAPRFPVSANVFSLRAPLIRKEGGFAWFTFEQAGSSAWKYNAEEVSQSEEYIRHFVRRICAVHDLDSSRVVLLGFSQGAIMAYEVAIKQPGFVSGVVALSGGMLPHKENGPPRIGTRFFIGHGDSDAVIPKEMSANAASYLSNRGAPVTNKVYHAVHQIPEEELRDIMIWLKPFLQKQ